MYISYFFRKPYTFHYSIETIFGEIIKNLPNDVQPRIIILPYQSKGLLPRIKNFLFVLKTQNEINHVTGDIHYVVLALKRNQTILTIHDLGFMEHNNPIIRFFLWLFWIWLPVRRSKYVTTISNATKFDILKYTRCNPQKIKVIPNFVNPSFYYSPKAFNKNKPVLLHVGTQFNKNLNRTILAIQDLNIILKIIGKLNHEHEMLLEEHNIHYLNFYELTEKELINHYISSDMLVFCSTLEGFGLPIIEAQTVGRPVVTSNISSMPEVAGDGACYADPYDANSIKKALIKVIKNDKYRDSIIEKGLQNVKRFNIQRISNMYYNLYEEIAGCK